MRESNIHTVGVRQPPDEAVPTAGERIHQRNLITLAGCLFAAFTLMAYGQATNNRPAKLPAAKAVGGAYAPVEDVPGLPQVLLIGDSISEGYTVPVRILLKGKANVHRIPENGGPTTNGLANLSQWLKAGKWAVIHFNWGLHDLKIMKDGTRQVSPADYEANLSSLVSQLQLTGAKLIWATTTPVPAEDVKLKVKRHAADVPVYNSIAKSIMDERHIVIDDVYSLALPQLSEIQMPADVHYTTRGYQVLGNQVAACIESALSKRP